MERRLLFLSTLSGEEGVERLEIVVKCVGGLKPWERIVETKMEKMKG